MGKMCAWGFRFASFHFFLPLINDFLPAKKVGESEKGKENE